MAVILSLQGCMAVGKTTADQYVKERRPDIFLSREDNGTVISEVHRRGLIKNCYEDYLEIQRLWLNHEVERWKAAKEHKLVLMDFGAEEIEFYTLNYPKSIGENWDIEGPLCRELEAVRRCMPDRILFLDADEETLKARKEGDKSRSREFFDFHREYLLPLKREWFLNRSDTDVLRVDTMDRETMGKAVLKWADAAANKI